MPFLLNFIIVGAVVVNGQENLTILPDKSDQRIQIIGDLVKDNLKTNGWNNILCFGHLPDNFYNKVKDLNLTFSISNIDVEDDYDIEGVVPYHSNFIVIDCINFEQFEDVITKVISLPYWHPLAHVILYYHTLEDRQMMSKLFYILWYYRAINVIIIQYDDSKDVLLVSYFNPYTSEPYRYKNVYGCRLTKKIGMPFDNFETGLSCEEGCENIPLKSKLRRNFFGTCLGYETIAVNYNDTSKLKKINLFENKAKNFYRYPLRAFGAEVLPFLEIRNYSDGTYSMHKRDAMVWNTMAEMMNFTIDLSPAEGKIKEPFDYDLSIQMLFAFSHRKFDLFLFPVYQYDLVLFQIDNTFPYKDSGVCFLAHRADFEMILFDEKLFLNNIGIVVQFLFCFLGSWFVFFIFNIEQGERISFDRAGKDFVNAVRTVLSMGLYNTPGRGSFRIYFIISLWSFFIINFSTQAAIISFFSAAKRGKEVDTFEDIAAKGYVVEGMASPDLILPDHKEIYRVINSRLVSNKDLFGCVKKMDNDSRRFCLLDCAVCKYLERNKMNDKGQQYLHVAKDKAHGHHLNMLLQKHSTITDVYNKYILAIVEAGLVTKWEQYRFTEIKEEAPVRAMGWEDVEGIYKCYVFFLILSIVLLKMTTVNASENLMVRPDREDQRIDIIVDIVIHNLKTNGWNNILCFGHLPDNFYNKVQELNLTFSISNVDVEDDYDIEGVVPYHSNFIVIDCINFEQFEDVITKVVSLPYWHPLAHVILYYHTLEDRQMMAKLFYILWYYRAINVIIIQYDDSKDVLLVSYFNPYTSEPYRYKNVYGCKLAKKIGMPFDNFENGFTCEESCENIPIQSKVRKNFFGTCLGYETVLFDYSNTTLLQKINLFESKVKDFHGYPLRAFGAEVLPFLEIRNYSDGTYTMHKRDAMVWNTMAEIMNFTLDLSPAEGKIKEPFDYDLNIQMVFEFSHRKFDLFLFPVYQFDLVLVEIDNTFPYKESGVCFLAHRADFETVLFDQKLLINNLGLVLQFLLCFLCSWFVFFIFNLEQRQRVTLDQAGKDLVNTVRTILSIGLYNPPKRGSFRIYLIISLWSFFIINFSTQAAIISFFSAAKRGKEVDTFEDIAEKGYIVEGMASPDVILPDHKEVYRTINSRLVSNKDLFGCVKKMSNDSHRFCLLDCAVCKYLERNKMNEKGEQYLHVAKDRAHGHYLNMLFQRNSAITEVYNKYILAIVEAGLVTKWEQYRFTEIKEEAPVRAMGWEDVEGIYKCYGLFLAISFITFLCEMSIKLIKKMKKFCFKKFRLCRHK
ncbi:PREDICTED: uncharacterized protein LOC106108423 [Papilio polytes]|uniref:uncharacterized protein LOC106108423 n=1 Tax=Papilio polytes TaxID=76194 RepID=UPI0006766203|nr:PREDICTED: uncharacterized protein LOC106108423 [Papilio polytes]